MPIINKIDLIYPDLSYKIIGAVFDVYNTLGYGYKELYYQKAVAESLRLKHLNFIEQPGFNLKYGDKILGRKRLDFIIENKIVLELKKGGYFSRSNIEQIYDYLKITGLKLALLVNFTAKGVIFKRIVNLK
ncbi:MAG: GxxExxY protein [Patescibacteria group bacterium]